MFKKLLYLILGWIVALSVTLIGLTWLFKHSSGLVLLYTPYLVMFASFVGIAVWLIKFREKFEIFLVYITYITSLFSFVILLPLAAERSLSSFIYFYTVEKGSFHYHTLSKEYLNDFVKKRLDDGIKGGFLIKKDKKYLPTTKTKIFYNLLYPLGEMTGTLENYKKFKSTCEHKKTYP